MWGRLPCPRCNRWTMLYLFMQLLNGRFVEVWECEVCHHREYR